MAYRNKVYISFDADNDMHYYDLLKAWKENDYLDFDFYDAHDVNNCYDKSDESIYASLEERFRNSKIFVLLIGEHTKYLYKFVRWEIEQAIKRDLPIICVNLNKKRSFDDELCPAILKDKLAIHISFEMKMIKFALKNWPDSFLKHQENGEMKPYRYNKSTYEKLGL